MSLQFGSNSFYQELLNETNRNRSAPPPLAKLECQAKTFSLHFWISRATPKFFQLRKRKCFCLSLPSMLRAGGGASLPARGRGRFPPPPPPPAAPSLFAPMGFVPALAGASLKNYFTTQFPASSKLYDRLYPQAFQIRSNMGRKMSFGSVSYDDMIVSGSCKISRSIL